MVIQTVMQTDAKGGRKTCRLGVFLYICRSNKLILNGFNVLIFSDIK